MPQIGSVRGAGSSIAFKFPPALPVLSDAGKHPLSPIPFINPLPITLVPVGITSEEYIPAPNVQQSFVVIEPSPVPSEEGFGFLSLSLVIQPQGIPGEGYGIPQIILPPLAIGPVSVASEEFVSVATLALNIQPVGVASLEAFGITTVINGEAEMLSLTALQFFG